MRWHYNLPILGWLLLLGRCRDCRSPISVRYPVVEAISAGLWLSAVYVQPGGQALLLPLVCDRFRSHTVLALLALE